MAKTNDPHSNTAKRGLERHVDPADPEAPWLPFLPSPSMRPKPPKKPRRKPPAQRHARGGRKKVTKKS